LTTKIHAIVDALGNPLAIGLTGGQVHDITQAVALLAEVKPQALIADKGYDADGFLDALTVRCIEPVIPPKVNRKSPRRCDFALYAERNLIERFFQFIKQFRGIATRYEKTARNFLAGLHLVCALAWLK
jgi:transposase